MSFVEPRLELGIPPSSGGAEFRTTAIKIGSGFEKRLASRSGYLFKGDIGKVLLTERDIAYITAFFCARKGRAIAFRWKYWADYTCTHEPEQIDSYTTTQGVARLVTGTTDTYQLEKCYTSFESQSYKKIYKPVEGTVEIYVNGVQQFDYTIDFTKGLVIFGSSPVTGSAIAWSGEFDLPVRFDSDKLPGVMEFIDPSTKELLFRFDSLPIVELNLEEAIAYHYEPRSPTPGQPLGITTPATGSGSGGGSSGGGGGGGSGGGGSSGGGTANQRHRCENGVCIPDPSGSYANLAECQAALIPAGFSGGQCVCVAYNVTVHHNNSGFNVPAQYQTSSVWGPITNSQLSINTGNNPAYTVEVLCRGAISLACSPTPVWVQFAFYSGGGQDASGCSIVSAVRIDGQPDNCGDPPPICGS